MRENSTMDFSPTVDAEVPLASWRGLPEPMSAAHRHEGIELNVPTGGPMHYLIAGSPVTVPDGATAVFWAALPHQLISAPHCSVQWLHVPLQTLLGWNPVPRLVERLLGGETLVLQPPQELARFTQWNIDLSGPETDLSDVAALEICAYLHRLDRLLPRQRPRASLAQGRRDTAVGHAIAMADFMARHHPRPLNVADVAGCVPLHPHYAMQVFRDVTGTTIVEYLTRRRVAEARRLLAATDLSPGRVGHEVGFGSQSRFYAAFRRITGCPPAAYRQAARSGGTSAGRTDMSVKRYADSDPGATTAAD
ncbi:helix-turn-helix domain-containing protein [Streptomyces sp. 142MFCol3.1]|uniref:helix-turn-helix domain-containing protein n=1 Tax=Streptomyces sp. 142MFCol3.1 TaxID=1172179 RepID=UPI000683FACC|nr:helix-turn-helix domain-containing protein [Streptomyces sp. 142MFCol3.1]